MSHEVTTVTREPRECFHWVCSYCKWNLSSGSSLKEDPWGNGWQVYNCITVTSIRFSPERKEVPRQDEKDKQYKEPAAHRKPGNNPGSSSCSESVSPRRQGSLPCTMPVKSGSRLRSPSATTLRNYDEQRGETGTWKCSCDVLERGKGQMKRLER